MAVAESGFRGPILYIFSGLPGSGKSTLAQLVASRLDAVYLRIDTIEQALRDMCSVEVRGEGYRLAYRIASDNLRLGLNVVADSCNPIELTRREWEQVARETEAAYINIEVICSEIADAASAAIERTNVLKRLALLADREVLGHTGRYRLVDRVWV